MSNWFPFPAYADFAPLDISYLFEDEKPAGKHGFLKTDGDRFVFEDGTPVKFWGTNLNSGAAFPEHEYAEKLAHRLASYGCNMVRFHQIDAEWATPNLYQYHKGRRLADTRTFDPRSLDLLDYFMDCLKKEGIYVYLDMITYRKFKSGDGVERAEELKDSAKPYSIYEPKLIELQKEYAYQIWTRHNQYTGLDYKDDPVFVMTEVTNECDVFTAPDPKKGPRSPFYEERFRQRFEAWIKEKGIDYDWDSYEMYNNTPELINFKEEITMNYYREMRDYLRSIGVKFPITGTNWTKKAPGNTFCQREMDFCDCHHYYYDWRWGEDEKCCTNKQIVESENVIFMPLTMRLNNKPFFISEWDMPWPNAFRAEGPIYYAAISALQNWSGMTIHTYAYGTRLNEHCILGKEVSSSTIAGVPYREGIFSTWNDPAKFGLFYHSALIVRRNDVSPATKNYGATIADRAKIIDTAARDCCDQYRLCTVLDPEKAVGVDEIISGADHVPSVSGKPGLHRSDNGQVWRNISKKIGGIDTPRTKVIYGKLSAARFAEVTADDTSVDGMKIEGKTDFGVIALSSLTNDPIEKSDNMLLSTIGRARNTDAVFDGDKMLEYGKAPILSEVIQAKISIRTERTDLKVWGVNAEGYYVGQKAATFEDGWMTFEVGDKFPASYYLIVAE